jgi:hypothetical protein
MALLFLGVGRFHRELETEVRLLLSDFGEREHHGAAVADGEDEARRRIDFVVEAVEIEIVFAVGRLETNAEFSAGTNVDVGVGRRPVFVGVEPMDDVSGRSTPRRPVRAARRACAR